MTSSSGLASNCKGSEYVKFFSRQTTCEARNLSKGVEETRSIFGPSRVLRAGCFVIQDTTRYYSAVLGARDFQKFGSA